jgi:dihydroorotate dehydrogenase
VPKLSDLYPLVRKGLFHIPAETAHKLVIGGLGFLPGSTLRAIAENCQVTDPRLVSHLWGIRFENPVGLAAGFDKSARAFNSLAALGFGFIEVGTITAYAQPGNAKPRIFRLPEDEALLNRMGFNNPGAEAVASRLARTPVKTVLGINVGKSKVTPIEEASGDYLRSIDLLAPYARYLVVNVSSPNTPGLRDLQDAGPLRNLLRTVVGRLDAGPPRKAPAPPVLLKLAPDLSYDQIDQAVDIAEEEGVAGIIATNTTISRQGLRTPADLVESLGAGGVSGRPVRARALQVVRRVYNRTGGRLPIIGVGGIFSAADAWEMIRAGASLVQVYTGFVYGGPMVVKTINQGLVEILEREGLDSITKAVGTGAS